jgi:quinol monooxygenase YgiN
MIRVLIERQCKAGKERALDSLLNDLRAKSLNQPGYISGETLVGIDDPKSFLVISTWTKLDTWKAWEDSQARHEVVHLIAPLITGEPVVRIYGLPSEEE